MPQLCALAVGVTGVVLYCIPMLKKRSKQKKGPQQAMAKKAVGAPNPAALVGSAAMAESVAAAE